MTKNELDDFEAFLEPSFDSLNFANGLLLATNDEENELDLATPMKKLKFDVEECEKRMIKISSTHYESLVGNLKDIETTKADMVDQIGPQLQRLNTLFERIKAGLMTPYEDAIKLNKSLKKMHTTLNLLRGAGFFMFLVQQLEEKEPAREASTAARNNGAHSGRSDLIRAAKVHIQLSKLYEAHSKSSAGSSSTSTGGNLMSIKLVRDYRSIYSLKRAELTSQCIQIITEDTTHATSFNFSNNQLHDALVALYILDPKECVQTIDRAILTKRTQLISNQLTRALQSPRNFTSVIEEISESSEIFLTKTVEVLENARVSDSTTLLKEFINIFNEEESLSKLYWRRITFKFKKNIAATMARGGPIAKNLKIYHEGINKAVKEKMSNNSDSKYLLDALDLIGGLQ